MLYLLFFISAFSLYFAVCAVINGRRGVKMRKNIAGKKGRALFLFASLVHFIGGLMIVTAFMFIVALIVYSHLSG
jgi:hypothetical protein